jgi:hypothetical protein
MLDQIIAAWDLLPFDVRYAVWLASGLLLLLCLIFLSYRVIRYSIGHRKFRGAWFNDVAFANLLNSILRDQKESGRVLEHDELRLIRRYVLPHVKPLHKGKFGGYF